MKHVRVRLTAGGDEAEIHPVYDLWANAEFIERSTALQWNFTGEELGILHRSVGDVDAFEAAIEAIPEVLAYDIVRTDTDVFYVYLRDTPTDAFDEMVRPFAESSLVVVPPVRYHEDGTVTFSIFGPDAEIQAGIDHLPAPMECTIEAISGLESMAATVETRLSRRQREAMEAAAELGYYEVPREASHEDVAAAIDCAPSTAAEHLRKAEATLVDSLFG